MPRWNRPAARSARRAAAGTADRHVGPAAVAWATAAAAALRSAPWPRRRSPPRASSSRSSWGPGSDPWPTRSRTPWRSPTPRCPACRLDRAGPRGAVRPRPSRGPTRRRDAGPPARATRVTARHLRLPGARPARARRDAPGRDERLRRPRPALARGRPHAPARLHQPHLRPRPDGPLGRRRSALPGHLRRLRPRVPGGGAEGGAPARPGACAEGVYLAIAGPAYATRAELRAFRSWGADAIGMSTVHEVTVARSLGCGSSACRSSPTWRCPTPAATRRGDDVLRMAAAAGGRFRSLVRRCCPSSDAVLDDVRHRIERAPAPGPAATRPRCGWWRSRRGTTPTRSGASCSTAASGCSARTASRSGAQGRRGRSRRRVAPRRPPADEQGALLPPVRPPARRRLAAPRRRARGRGAKHGHVFPVLLQVNVAGEAQQARRRAGGLADLVARVPRTRPRAVGGPDDDRPLRPRPGTRPPGLPCPARAGGAHADGPYVDGHERRLRGGDRGGGDLGPRRFGPVRRGRAVGRRDRRPRQRAGGPP
jgi:hypothetical protein